MKRLRVILLFLLLGALVNVAVASYGAVVSGRNYDILWMSYDLFGEPDPLPTEFLTKMDEHHVKPNSDEVLQGGIVKAFGITRTEAYGVGNIILEIQKRGGGGSGSGANTLAAQIKVGFPLRTFVGYEWFDNDYTDSVITSELEYARWINVTVDMGGPLDWRIPVPLKPIWTGFAINTIFYAAILWLLIPGPFVLRRFIRRKRGLCVKCAYDLRGADHEACPECGAEVRKVGVT